MSWSWLRGWGGNEAEASWEQHLASNATGRFWPMWGARQLWLSIPGWKFLIKSAQQQAFLLLSPITTNSCPVTSLDGGSHCRAEDGERPLVAPDQQWQMCHVLPKNQQWCVSPYSHEGHWCSACWDTQTWGSSTLLSCWRGHFPSCTKYGSNIRRPLVFPRVIWGTENSGGGYSLVSTPHCFPPTVGKARAGRMGRTGLEYLAAPTEHPPEWVSRLWAASVQGTWHTVTKRCLCGVSLLVPNEHVPELWPCSAIQPLAGQWFLWAWASKSLTARERWWHSFWCSAASLGQSRQIKHHGIPGMKTSDPQTQSPGIIPGMHPQP